ncbi:L,D-transpeptidase family protein [Rhodoplanes elegans]|nr:L,D-transpeptidase family protein [Rhodoplanes elegans]
MRATCLILLAAGVGVSSLATSTVDATAQTYPGAYRTPGTYAAPGPYGSAPVMDEDDEVATYPGAPQRPAGGAYGGGDLSGHPAAAPVPYETRPLPPPGQADYSRGTAPAYRDGTPYREPPQPAPYRDTFAPPQGQMPRYAAPAPADGPLPLRPPGEIAGQAPVGQPGIGQPPMGGQGYATAAPPAGYGAQQAPGYGAQPGYGVQPGAGYGAAPPAYGSQPGYGAPAYGRPAEADRAPVGSIPPGTAPQGGAGNQAYAALGPDYQPETERKELPPQFKRQLVDYQTTEPAGTIVVDTPNTYLYLVLGNGKAMRYGIGVGREGFTWTGVERVSRMAEWPDWHPPAEMIERQPYLPRFMAGGESNPMGARALYLGKTVYRIHGTNQPSTIGSFVSSGCIRLVNEDIEDLYRRVGVGTRVVVKPKASSGAVQTPPAGPQRPRAAGLPQVIR